MKFAVTFGRMHPRLWVEAAEAADRLGFESVWLPEHLVLPVAMSGSPARGRRTRRSRPRPSSSTRRSYLSFIAVCTQIAPTRHVRLPDGPASSLRDRPGLRHTDWVSAGRAVIGVAPAGCRRKGGPSASTRHPGRPARRGHRRVPPALDGAHRGQRRAVLPLRRGGLEPEPVQQPIPSSSVTSLLAPAAGGRLGDGWIGMTHTPDPPRPAWAAIRVHREEAGRLDQPFEVTVGGECTSEDDVVAWATRAWTASSCRRRAFRPRCSMRWPLSRPAPSGSQDP